MVGVYRTRHGRVCYSLGCLMVYYSLGCLTVYNFAHLTPEESDEAQTNGDLLGL